MLHLDHALVEEALKFPSVTGGLVNLRTSAFVNRAPGRAATLEEVQQYFLEMGTPMCGSLGPERRYAVVHGKLFFIGANGLLYMASQYHEILLKLLEAEPMTVRDFSEIIGQAPSNVSSYSYHFRFNKGFLEEGTSVMTLTEPTRRLLEMYPRGEDGSITIKQLAWVPIEFGTQRVLPQHPPM